MDYIKYILVVLTILVSAERNIITTTSIDVPKATPTVTTDVFSRTINTKVVVTSYCSGTIVRYPDITVSYPVANYSLACPTWWEGDLIYWQGRWGICHDTGKYDELESYETGEILPHIDYYANSCQESINWGQRDQYVQRLPSNVIGELGIERSYLLPSLE